jgi:hypothetical protein
MFSPNCGFTRTTRGAGVENETNIVATNTC